MFLFPSEGQSLVKANFASWHNWTNLKKHLPQIHVPFWWLVSISILSHQPNFLREAHCVFCPSHVNRMVSKSQLHGFPETVLPKDTNDALSLNTWDVLFCPYRLIKTWLSEPSSFLECSPALHSCCHQPLLVFLLTLQWALLWRLCCTSSWFIHQRCSDTPISCTHSLFPLHTLSLEFSFQSFNAYPGTQDIQIYLSSQSPDLTSLHPVSLHLGCLRSWHFPHKSAPLQ